MTGSRPPRTRILAALSPLAHGQPAIAETVASLPDRGTYTLTLPFSSARSLRVGSLGTLYLKEGSYVYIGSARPNLRSRVARHLARRKRVRWHVDHITSLRGHLPVEVGVWRDLTECGLAGFLKKSSDGFITGFGSSDCGCGSHLIYFADSNRRIEAILSASPDVLVSLGGSRWA